MGCQASLLSEVRIATLLLVFALAAACGMSVDQPSSGSVKGIVMGWPAGPQSGKERPAVGAHITFIDKRNRSAGVATTGNDGRFEHSLPAGEYLVQIEAFGQEPVILAYNGVRTNGTSVYVTVDAGKTTSLSLVVETGIR
jgi:Carboxypeptidase regulatory-like domain